MSPEPNPFGALSSATSTLVAAASRSVVGVRDAHGRGLSGIVWEAGRVVTAEECLVEDDPVSLLLPSGRVVGAQLAGRDPTTDVALLSAAEVPAAPLATVEPPAVGSLVLVVGRGEEGPLAAMALVAASGPAWTSATGGRIDGLVRLGLFLPHALEGGAVVDAEGRLLGLAVADPRRRALVIPASTVSRSVATLATRGHVGRGYLGLSLRPLGSSPGLMVLEVAADSPAATAGFLLGDIVTTWEGEPVENMRGLARHLGPESVGREVNLGIVRAGEPREVRVTIGERRRGEE